MTAQFHKRIDSWVLAGLQTCDREQCTIFHKLPGVYPSEVLRSINRLIKARKLDLRRTPVRLQIQGTKKEDVPSCLPTPHPLDFDWRFLTNGRKLLLGRLEHADESVVMLGCPTLFEAAINERVRQKLLLLDNNAVAVNALKHYSSSQYKAIGLDLSHGILPQIKADAVFADPPWYPEYMQSFSHAAARLARKGGRYYLCMPPAGTRPRVEKENASLIRYCYKLGFRLLSYHKGIISYSSPRFEVNALSAEGVHEYPDDWRNADLATFILDQHPSSIVKPVRKISHPWQEEIFRGMRLKLRIKKPSASTSPLLVPLIEGNIFPSVSRRHPLRRSVDLWTSGNRVYACENTSILSVIIRSHSEGRNVSSMIKDHLNRRLTPREQQQIRQASEQLESLRQVEQLEKVNWIVNA